MNRRAPSGARGCGRGERGVIVVLFSFLLVALLLGLAFVVDLGRVADQRRKAQNAADPAALAAAWALRNTTGAAPSEAAEAARVAGATNLGVTMLAAGSGCVSAGVCFSSPEGWTVSVETPYAPARSATAPERAVRVEACRSVPTAFAGVVGVSAIRVCGSAVASADAGELRARPGILVLGRARLEVAGGRGTKPGLSSHGLITVTGGGIHVNSRHRTDALVLRRPSSTTANAINVVGGVNRSAGTTVTGLLSSGAAVLSDPLADVPEPPLPGAWPAATTVAGAGVVTTLYPGTYGALTVDTGATVVLHGPGVFVFNGIRIGGDGSLLRSTSAMLYNVGELRADAGAEVSLQAMTLVEATAVGVPQYAEIAYFQGRCTGPGYNSAKCDAGTGTGHTVLLKGRNRSGVAWGIEGALYAPTSKVEIRGISELFDPPADNDDDPTNDSPYPDYTDPADAELDVAMRGSMMIVGQLSVGRGASLRLQAAGPPAARWASVALVE
jgi:hypothetical protein